MDFVSFLIRSGSLESSVTLWLILGFGVWGFKMGYLKRD